MSTREDLRELPRAELLSRARMLGIAGADALADEALVAAIERRVPARESSAPRGGGWFGRARDLVARVVEQGLHLPEAASLLRGATTPPPPAPPPLPTVTLAEIYAAQGHTQKALTVLAEVLDRTPEHTEALALRRRLSGEPETALSHVDDAKPADECDEAETTEASAAKTKDEARAKVETVEAHDDAKTTDEARSDVEKTDEARAAESTDPQTEAAPTQEGAEATATKRGKLRRMDDVVCLPTDPTSLFIYWELRPITFARARWRDSRGKLIVRVVSVEARLAPDSADIVGEERDIEIDELSGERFVHDLPSGTEVRLCVGWLGPKGFVPLAIAASVSMPRNYESSREAVATADAQLAASWRHAMQTAPPAGTNAEIDLTLASERLRRVHANPLLANEVPIVRFAPAARGLTRPTLAFGGASDQVRSAVARAASARIDRGGASDAYGGASDRYS